MTTTMRIERAQDTDENLGTAVGFINQASGWLRTKDTDQWADRWPTKKERQGYVHRLVTARGYTGLGLGAALIDWAGRRGRLYYGAKWIRIDVWTTNKRLHKYYENQQFEPCGLCTDEEYPSGALFQKNVSTIEEPAVIPHADDDSVEFDLACPVRRRRELVLT